MTERLLHPTCEIGKKGDGVDRIQLTVRVFKRNRQPATLPRERHGWHIFGANGHAGNCGEAQVAQTQLRSLVGLFRST